MEHIYIKELEDGFYELKPYDGYILWNENTQRKFSEAITKSTKGFVAILNGIPPEPHVRTLGEAKREKISKLKAYDASPAVNTFYLNGNPMWIDYNLRNDYLIKVQSAKRLNYDTIPFLGNNIAVDSALHMLDSINVYAMECSFITDSHKDAINALNNIREVDNYDFTVGYPEKIRF